MRFSSQTYKKIGFNLLFVSSLVLIVVVAISFSKDFLRIKQINNELRELEQQIAEVDGYNLEISELLKYFDTDSFAELKARTELGLKKEGEKIVIIANDELNDDHALDISEEKNKSDSNIRKWLSYIFKL